MHSASLLLWSWLHVTPLNPPAPGEACEDLHVELARPLRPLEVCIRTGRLTGFVFDVPIDAVEVQDAVRFVEVNRGRRVLDLMPPPDLQVGERLRLTVEFMVGATRRSVTFMLVAHAERATHQVQVFLDTRPVEVLRQTLEEEQAKNHRLQDENAHLREQLARPLGLGALLMKDRIGTGGVQAAALRPDTPIVATGGLAFKTGRAFRIKNSVTAQVWLMNAGSTPWSATGAALVDEQGKELQGLRVLQARPIEVGKLEAVVVETDDHARSQGRLTLRLWDQSGRVITLFPVVFPAFDSDSTSRDPEAQER
ncbi:DUF2381 family protein [Archangium primigenium]|uniref:DUF2381 family protein n=1 Tax=[Archangium] primigenium TaxID=2792470 RepID=UPI0019583444|nr:DUF2381 family protein [Archangium primigenium]